MHQRSFHRLLWSLAILVQLQGTYDIYRKPFAFPLTGRTTIYGGAKTRQGALLQGASCVISLLRRPMTASSGPNKVTHLGARKAFGRGNRRRLGHAYYLKT